MATAAPEQRFEEVAEAAVAEAFAGKTRAPVPAATGLVLVAGAIAAGADAVVLGALGRITQYFVG